MKTTIKNIIFILVISLSISSYSQSIKNINTVKDAEQFLAKNPKIKHKISLFEISHDSLDYYKKEFASKDYKNRYKLIEIITKTSMRVSYIFLDGNKMTLPNINKKRTDLIKMYKQGKPFATLANQNTMDGNKNGGDLGWFNEGKMEKVFEETVKKCVKNDIFTVDIPEKKWYYVVLKTYNDIKKHELYFFELNKDDLEEEEEETVAEETAAKPLKTVITAKKYINENFTKSEETILIANELNDSMGMNMSIIGDEILRRGYTPDGFTQKEGYRIYKYKR